jgi:hypothetical protein
MPAAAQDADAVERARALFWEGNHDYAEERYDAAIVHFEAAYALSSNARLLDYIGRCYANLGQLRDAIEAYERFAATSVEAQTEALPILVGLRADLTRLVMGQAMDRVGNGLAASRGEQPPPRDRMRRALGTQMRDVPVLIRSTPPGADVFIDGTEFGAFGQTPLETRLFTGQHVIEVRSTFYAPSTQVVSVAVPRRGEAVPTYSFELERLQVPVSVSVEPLTANVTYIGEDGVSMRLGLGGFEGELPAGPGSFIVQQGGRDRTIEVVLVPLEDEVARFELFLEDPAVNTRQEIRVGTLAVESELLFGDIYIDGARVGSAPGRVERDVTPGPHRIEVRRDGYVPFIREVNVSADRETVVVVNTLERAGGGTAGAGWAMFGVGVAAAGTGGALLALDAGDGASVGLLAGGGALVVGGLTWALAAKARQRGRVAGAPALGWSVLPTAGGWHAGISLVGW